ncbi:hypothetical protein SKAU_G00384420 [Synaphobranchus kaupii]|uniref:BTB domain-containing protein n=1 Tax=Synaphobranchus kaupii TaxID=118154 RepID=A0A9Q1EE88_SYNKA|nr:hypothetical protein SKAU_G00384420 [Synaphobranchus kaupii]
MALPVNPIEEPRMYHQTLLQDGLCDLLENMKFVDCVLKVKDKELPCHRLVLAACSPFFKFMFQSDSEECKKREVVLENVEPSVMATVLRYIYTSDINLTENNVHEIFMAANVFQIPSIFTVCVSFLRDRLSLGNCLAIFRLGLLLDCSDLAVAARNYVCDHYQGDRIKELPDLLECVRFRLMDADYFAEKGGEAQVDQVQPGAKRGRWPTTLQETNVTWRLCPLRFPRTTAVLSLRRTRYLWLAGFSTLRRTRINHSTPTSYSLTQLTRTGWECPPSQRHGVLFGMAEAENSIFVVGGKELKKGEHALDSVMIYDRHSFKWGESDPLPYTAYGHATVSHNGLVYVIGGKGASKKCLRKVCVYNPKKFEWKDLAPLKTARSLFGVTVHKDKIYVATGVTDAGLTSTVEVYDITSNTWSEFVDFPQERSSLNLVSMGGSLYAVGGFAMMPQRGQPGQRGQRGDGSHGDERHLEI